MRTGIALLLRNAAQQCFAQESDLLHHLGFHLVQTAALRDEFIPQVGNLVNAFLQLWIRREAFV